MPNAIYTNFDGLLLPLDPRRIAAPYAVDGRNFVPAVDGLKSEFAAQVVIAATERQDGMEDTTGATTINLPNHETSYFCNRNGIFEIVASDFRLVPRFRLETPPETVYKWTAAEVGDAIFFARRDVGLISYHQPTGRWQHHAPETVYEDIIACTEIGGRLFLATGRVVAWSAIDDGYDLVTRVETGAGAQGLTIIGVNDTHDVITCMAYEQGVITYTRGGYLRSELIDSPLIFRHRPVFTRNESPLSDFAITQFVQQSHLWFSVRGFFVHDGRNAPQPWQPLMGENIRQRLRTDSAVLFSRARLHYAPVEGWITVSLDTEENSLGNFDLCYVFVIVTEGWGVFNRQHSGWHTVQLVPRQLSTCYTTTSQKALYRITAQNFVETLETLSAQELAKVLLVPANLSTYTLEQRSIPIDEETEVTAYSWEEELQGETFVYDQLFRLSFGWYEITARGAVREAYGDTVGYEFIEFPEELLDAEISIGLFRMPEGTETQQLSCLDELLCHTEAIAQRRTDHVDLAEDFAHGSNLRMELPTNENIISDAQAFESDVPLDDPFRGPTRSIAREPYRVDVRSSRDTGIVYNVAGNQVEREEGPERGNVRAQLDRVALSAQSQLWRCESYGKYHLARITCPERGNHFYIRAIDVNLRPSGVHP